MREGEIVGVAGVDGNGQTELAETLAGLREADAGTLRIGGEELTDASVARRRAAGLAYIPDDRYARGLARAASITDNLLMGRHHGRLAPRGLLDRRAIARARAAAGRAVRRPRRLGLRRRPRRCRAATRRSS